MKAKQVELDAVLELGQASRAKTAKLEQSFAATRASQAVNDNDNSLAHAKLHDTKLETRIAAQAKSVNLQQKAAAETSETGVHDLDRAEHNEPVPQIEDNEKFASEDALTSQRASADQDTVQSMEVTKILDSKDSKGRKRNAKRRQGDFLDMNKPWCLESEDSFVSQIHWQAYA